MRFSTEQIHLARRLREAGLHWEPQAGHFVYDETNFCDRRSPFQDRVFFILNYDYFIDRVGGLQRFKDIMLWLPTWHDCRMLLRAMGVDDAEIANHLAKSHALEQRRELTAMYELILEQLQTRHPDAETPLAMSHA